MNISCCKSYVGKQIIGVLPNQSDCLFYYAPDVNIDGYRIDGIIYDDYTFIGADLNPYGIYYFITFLPDSGEPRFILTYVGNEPPTYLPAITDNNGDPVTWGWTTCCTKVCLEMTINENDYIYFKNGYGYVCYSQTTGFDDQIPMETLLKSLYGQQTTYTYTDNGDGTFYIKIDNAFVCNLPLSWSEDNLTYTDMVPCGTPPAAVCAYYNQIIDNASGCFSTGFYDFEGCGIDFNCLSSLYPNGYYVQDSSGAIFDFCSHLTVISNSTSQPAPINYLDFNGNPQTSYWTYLCNYGCVQTNLFFVDNLIQEISFCGIDISMSSYGGDLDLYDIPIAETVLFGVFKTYFPSCTGVSIYFDGVKSLRITIFDIYYNSTSTLSVSTVQETKILGLFPC